MWNGVWQLKTLTIRYCKHGGSSRGVRELIETGKLEEFREATKDTGLRTNMWARPNKHPQLIGKYINDKHSVICVKNLDGKGVLDTIHKLRNRGHRDWTTFSKWHQARGQTQSVQGKWEPFTFTGHAPRKLAPTHSVGMGGKAASDLRRHGRQGRIERMEKGIRIQYDEMGVPLDAKVKVVHETNIPDPMPDPAPRRIPK